MLRLFSIPTLHKQIVALETELAALTGKPVKHMKPTVFVVKANKRIDELEAAIAAAKSAKLSRGQSDATPILTQPWVASVPTAAPISSPSPVASVATPWTGAKLATLTKMFPTLASREFASDADKWDAVESEAYKAGLVVPGMRSDAELAPLYGTRTEPTSATAIATATLRQSALDSICGVAPRRALTKPTLAAPVVTGGKLDVNALAGLYDAIAGDGAASRRMEKPYAVDVSADGLAARANAVQYSTWQSAAVRKEMQRRFQARQASQPDNSNEVKRVLLTDLFHLGVRHPALDFTGIVPDETKVERGPRRIELANRKAAAFLDALAGGTQVVNAADVGAVEAARELIRAKTGKRYTVGATYFAPEQKTHPFSTIPTH